MEGVGTSLTSTRKAKKPSIAHQKPHFPLEACMLSLEACVKRPLKRASEGDASEMAGSMLKSPKARFLNFEVRFNPSFLDAPAQIELQGFEAGGGSFRNTGCDPFKETRPLLKDNSSHNEKYSASSEETQPSK
jgi:hypothetical protein